MLKAFPHLTYASGRQANCAVVTQALEPDGLDPQLLAVAP